METPLVTIILTSFNRAHLISETIESIIAQNYINWECLIIDDNSEDSTQNVVLNATNKDSRFTFIKKPKLKPKGLPASRNIGIPKAKGHYITFCDDDDVMHPELISHCVNEFKKNEELSFVHYMKKSFSKKSPEIKSLPKNLNIIYLQNKLFEKVILGELAMASCTVMWRKQLLLDNPFKESLMYAEELECYSRILMNNLGIKGVKINLHLYFNRKHPNSNTGEFWNNNYIRKQSYIKALKLICDAVVDKNIMSSKLRIFFFHHANILNATEIIEKLLSQYALNRLKFEIFKMRYRIYKAIKS